MNKLFILLAFAGVSMSILAQYKISGEVKDAKDNDFIPYATIALMRSDSTVITGTATDNDGKFVINNVVAGEYLLQISYIGYEKVVRTLNVPAQSDVGEIILSESENSLAEVVVTASRPLLINKIDRYIVNVSGNIQSAGRNSLEILRNTPGLLVDQQGNISVMGKNVAVWIDGRPSHMSGEQLQSFLNAMQGGEIDRIEVITNPSSRYDAEGVGGIIDIRTKKGLELGMNGTLTAGFQQGHKDKENASLDLNWRREKFNLSGAYSVLYGNNWEKISQINVMQTPTGAYTFDQHSLFESNKRPVNHQIRTGLDYNINSKNMLGVIVKGYYRGDSQSLLKGTTHISPVYEGVKYSESDNRHSGPNSGIQLNMNYQSTFDKPRQRLTFDADYARFTNLDRQETTNRYYDQDNTQVGAPEQLRHKDPKNIDVYSVKTDYRQPLWEDAEMESGVKISQSKIDADMKFDRLVNDKWQVDADRTNRFVYSEQIDAIYLNLSQDVGNISLQAGIRGEYTRSQGDQKTKGLRNDTTYFNLFPSFYADWELSEMHNLGLSYSRRLSRPNFEHLNTFEVALDAYSFYVGNPSLTPSYTHNIELSYMYGQNLMAQIGYSNTTDLIIRTPIEEAATHRYGTTYSNFGRSQELQAMVYYNRSIAKFWKANLTVVGMYLNNTSDEVSGEFVNKGGSLIAQLNNNFTITPTLSADISGMYISGIRQGYFTVQSQGYLTIGLRQSLLQNKMTLSLNIEDILHTSVDKLRAQYENINYSLNYRRDSRYAKLTLRYNFGSKTVKAARNKTTGIENEASRAGR